MVRKRFVHLMYSIAVLGTLLGRQVHAQAGIPAGTTTFQAPAAPVQVPASGQSGSQTGQTTGQTGQGSSPANRVDSNARVAQDAKTQDARTQSEGSPITVQDVPTEFQRLVASSIGIELPVFGANLFNNVPSTFAPVDNIPVTPDYIVGPGDELRIQLFGQVNQEGTYTVDRTGNLSYPDVGTLHVAGIRYDQLESFLRSQLARVYRNFDLTVNLGQLRSIQIFVTGFARRPGAYTVSSLSTLLNAIFASGGVLPQGSLRDIQLLRGGRTVVHFDLYDLLLRGDKSKDMQLAPGDVLFIPTVGEQAAISGSVSNPAIYEIKPGNTVNELIALAGGRTSVALGTKVRLERIYAHTERTLVDVDLASDADPVLANGDIVTVGTILDRFKDAVTLRGNVSFPGRYVWHPGMRLLDLVPTRELLITRESFRRRNAQGNPAGADGDLRNEGELRLSGNGETQAADQAVANGSTGTARGGSVGSALTSSSGLFPAVTDVVLSAPDLDWSYATIERLDPQNLTTSLIPFNPGKLYKQGDMSQNLELQVGDVVTFFSTADIKVPTSQQTRFVRLEGEFVASGVYSVQPGETLRHLLARVGGFTDDAYLYGSEFTRLSTRRVQQQRLNEYADNLEAQASILNASASSRAVNDRDASAAAASNAATQTLVARLRRQVPLGRIVLEVKPDSRGVEAVPDLALEDGDRFVVPRVPSTVSVEGQVYSANSYVFQRNRKERDYLRQAGGPDREADPKRTFILRADGSVYSSQYGNVARATMFPGDTIVVPPQLDRRALLRNVVDIAQVIGQLGVGVAAIALLATR